MKNPWLPGSINFSHQAEIARASQPLAERLKADAAAAASAANPWSPESLNLTRQCEILKADPARAARLKAQAASPAARVDAPRPGALAQPSAGRLHQAPAGARLISLTINSSNK